MNGAVLMMFFVGMVLLAALSVSGASGTLLLLSLAAVAAIIVAFMRVEKTQGHL